MAHLLFMAMYLSTQGGDQKADEAQLAALKAEARAEVKATCAQAAQCKAMPMGARSCGGPSEFLVYCSASSDEAKLAAKAKAVTDAEAAFNKKYGIASICSVLPKPQLILKAGGCVVAETKPADVPM